MHLTRLRYFVAIADEENVGRAAKRLRVAQPALTRQLRALEMEVGTPLFERHPRGVRLTAAGEAFLEHARRAIAAVDAGFHAARATGESRLGVTLRVGTPDWAHRARPVARAIDRLKETNPEITIEFDPTPWLVQAAAVLDAVIDVGFGVAMSPEDYGPGIEATRLLDEPASGALLPDQHPLAQRESLVLADLRNLPTLVPPRDVVPLLHDQMVGTIRRAGYEPRVLPAPISFAAAAQLVVAGAGWIITVLSIGEMPPAGTRVVPIRDASVMLGFFALCRRDDRRAQVVRFIDCMHETFRKVAEGGANASVGAAQFLGAR